MKCRYKLYLYEVQIEKLCIYFVRYGLKAISGLTGLLKSLQALRTGSGINWPITVEAHGWPDGLQANPPDQQLGKATHICWTELGVGSTEGPLPRWVWGQGGRLPALCSRPNFLIQWWTSYIHYFIVQQFMLHIFGSQYILVVPQALLMNSDQFTFQNLNVEQIKK